MTALGYHGPKASDRRQRIVDRAVKAALQIAYPYPDWRRRAKSNLDTGAVDSILAHAVSGVWRARYG